MGKVEDNKQKKEQSLLESAFTLFTTKGIARTSIADIVEHAGMAKGTFYLYFRDKYEVQEVLIRRKSSQIFRRALASSGYEQKEGFAEQLIALVDNILDQLRRDPVLLRFMGKNLSWGIFHRALDKAPDRYLVPIQEILSASGETVENPLLLLYTVVELVGSTCHSVILEQDPAGLDAYKPFLYRSIRAIIEEFRVRPEQA